MADIRDHLDKGFFVRIEEDGTGGGEMFISVTTDLGGTMIPASSVVPGWLATKLVTRLDRVEEERAAAQTRLEAALVKLGTLRWVCGGLFVAAFFAIAWIVRAHE